jgi:hypothetical protein
MTGFILLVVAALAQVSFDTSVDLERLFDRGKTWEQFLDGVVAQRDVWIKAQSGVTVPPELAHRARVASRGLWLVVVAEDWCPDSAYTLPFVARLAEASGIPLRILDRTLGEPLMRVHRTPDGRTATPTIVLARRGRDVGAWVERPAELQRMFLSMSTNPASAERFAQRHAWYESDAGRSVLTEMVALIEQARERD